MIYSLFMWEKERLKELIKKHKTIAKCLKAMNQHLGTSSYRKFHECVRTWNLDISHFTGQAHLSGTKRPNMPKIPLENLLTENSTHDIKYVKSRLLRENILPYECNICKIDSWLDAPLSLHIDHINGINTDNRLENLRLLCPNCHSQTDTYCGRNIKKKSN